MLQTLIARSNRMVQNVARAARARAGWPMLLMTLVSCSTGRSSTLAGPARPAREVPARFATGAGLPAQEADAQRRAACHNPLFDPRDDTRIVLQRSAQGRGDYSVPDQRYGVGPDELLRVDCTTGAAIGIVRR